MKKPKELISPGGKLRAPAPSELPATDDRIEPLIQRKIAFACGHRGPEVYAMRLNGEIVYLNAKQMQEREMCGNCLAKAIAKATIRCALCGRRIHSDMPAALYEYRDGFRKDATRVEFEDKICVVGCPRCAPGPDFFAGIWCGNRFISKQEIDAALERAPSEMGGLASQCEECEMKDSCPERGKRGGDGPN